MIDSLIQLFEELFPTHNYRWAKSGLKAKGFCPFHSDRRSPSLALYTSSTGIRKWYCFSDQFGGTEIDLVIRALKITRAEANRWLISKGYKEETEAEARESERNAVLSAFYEYTNTLLCTEARMAGIRSYFATRGIKAEMLPNLAVGVYPSIEQVEVWCEVHGVAPELRDILIPSSRSKGAAAIVENSIAFFYRSSYDTFSRIKVRNVMNESASKNTGEAGGPEKETMWLGKGKASDNGFFLPIASGAYNDYALAVEGEFDALGLFSLCLQQTTDAKDLIVCFGGGAGLEHGIDILTSAGIENLYIFPDNDESGLKYVSNIAENHDFTYIIYPEDYKPGEDPNLWAKRHKFSDLQAVLLKRVPSLHWVGNKLAEDFKSANSVEEREHIKAKFHSYGKKLASSKRWEFCQKYAEVIGAKPELLLEEIDAEDNAKKYKIRMHNAESFGVYMDVPRGKEVVPFRISNVIIEHLYDIIYEDEVPQNDTRIKSDQIRVFVVKLRMYDKEVVAAISHSDFQDDRKLAAFLDSVLGNKVQIAPKKIQYLREATREMQNASANDRPEETVLRHTGWRDGKFYMPNGFVDENGFQGFEDIKVELPKENEIFTSFRFNQPPADLTFAKDLIRNKLLGCVPYEISLPMLAHYFLPPLLEYLPNAMPYALWVMGSTGSQKTTYISILTSFYGNFHNRKLLGWRSTANSMEKFGYYLKDVIYPIDDYKRGDVPMAYLTTFMQNYANRQGRSRLRSNMEAQALWYVRGLITSTAEDIPTGESSVLSRMLVVNFPQHGKDLKKMREAEVQADPSVNIYAGVMAKYVQFLINKKLKQRDLYAMFSDKRDSFKTAHSRVTENLALNAVGWEFMSEFLELKDLEKQYYNGLSLMQSTMDQYTHSERASTMFVDLVKELLSSGKYYLEGYSGEQDTPHTENATKLGWVGPQNVYLLGNSAIAAANALRERVHGSAMKYSNQAIYAQLDADGLLEKQRDHYIGGKSIYGTTHRVLFLKRGVVEQSDRLGVEATDEDRGLWSSQNSALLS